jgi:hypothetical protein
MTLFPTKAITHSISELAEKLSGSVSAEVEAGGDTKKDKKSWLKFLGK